jgi:hypothetical protein
MSLSKVWAHSSEVTFRCSTLGKLLAIPTNIRLGWRWPNRTVQLLVPYLSYKEKKVLWRRNREKMRFHCRQIFLLDSTMEPEGEKAKCLVPRYFVNSTTTSNAKKNTCRSHPPWILSPQSWFDTFKNVFLYFKEMPSCQNDVAPTCFVLYFHLWQGKVFTQLPTIILQTILSRKG